MRRGVEEAGVGRAAARAGSAWTALIVFVVVVVVVGDELNGLNSRELGWLGVLRIGGKQCLGHRPTVVRPAEARRFVGARRIAIDHPRLTTAPYLHKRLPIFRSRLLLILHNASTQRGWRARARRVNSVLVGGAARRRR